MSTRKLGLLLIIFTATTQALASDWGEGFNLSPDSSGSSSSPARFTLSAWGGLSTLSGGVKGTSGFENTLKSSSGPAFGGKVRYSLGTASSKNLELEFIQSNHKFDIAGDNISVTAQRAIVRYSDSLFTVGQTKVSLGVGAFLFQQGTNATATSPVFTHAVSDGLTLGFFSTSTISNRFQLDVGAEGWFATSLREFPVQTGSLRRAISGRVNPTLYFRINDSVKVGTGAWLMFDLRQFRDGGTRGSSNAEENLTQWIIPVVFDVSF